MSIISRRPMSLSEFLAWEERQEERWEFDGTQPVAMTGGTNRHATICSNLRALLYIALRGKPCRSKGPDLKIEVAGRIRYPDAFVHCNATGPSVQVIPDPVVVFEVLSPSTSRIDRIVKLREYQATDTIQRYVILEQDSVAAMVFAREGGIWTGRALTNGEILAMPEIDIEIALADIYAGADLPSPEDEAPAER
jgi:Uma2 family endonuclease